MICRTDGSNGEAERDKYGERETQSGRVRRDRHTHTPGETEREKRDQEKESKVKGDTGRGKGCCSPKCLRGNLSEPWPQKSRQSD